jgi:hypothetical protein
MRQRQCGCLEIVDDLNRLEAEPIPQVSTIDGPSAVGEIAALALYRSRDGEQRVRDSMIVRVLQEVFDGAAEWATSIHLIGPSTPSTSTPNLAFVAPTSSSSTTSAEEDIGSASESSSGTKATQSKQHLALQRLLNCVSWP